MKTDGQSMKQKQRTAGMAGARNHSKNNSTLSNVKSQGINFKSNKFMKRKEITFLHNF